VSDRETALSGRAFGSAAAEYVAGRPDYPAEAVAWLVGDAREVADVGAGTGKLTAALVAAGAHVTAVEPDVGMLDALRREVPEAVPLQGSAEHLPLGDAAVDAMVFGQAWHWVDVPAASAEAARVLRPGGVLGLVWNLRDASVDWVAALGALMHGSAAEVAIETDAIAVDPPFGPLVRREWSWTRPMTVDSVLAMAASRSYLIALEPDERAALLDRIRALLTSHPDTAGRAEFPMPYTTVAFRTVAP
jgi:SAM-dependent methyltransferase